MHKTASWLHIWYMACISDLILVSCRAVGCVIQPRMMKCSSCFDKFIAFSSTVFIAASKIWIWHVQQETCVLYFVSLLDLSYGLSAQHFHQNHEGMQSPTTGENPQDFKYIALSGTWSRLLYRRTSRLQFKLNLFLLSGMYSCHQFFRDFWLLQLTHWFSWPTCVWKMGGQI